MNDHAKWVYWYFSKGHKQDMGVNIRWYHKIPTMLWWVISTLLMFVVICSLVLWPFGPWRVDKFDDIRINYDKFLARKGIIIDKNTAFVNHCKSTGLSSPAREDEFTKKNTITKEVSLSPARVFRLLSKNDGFYEWKDLGLTDEDFLDIISTLGIKAMEYLPVPDIKINENNLTDGKYKVKFTHRYVNDNYWKTDYGKKLLELKLYQHTLYRSDGEPYRKYGEKKDSWYNYGAGQKVTHNFISILEVEFYI